MAYLDLLHEGSSVQIEWAAAIPHPATPACIIMCANAADDEAFMPDPWILPTDIAFGYLQSLAHVALFCRDFASHAMID